MVERGPQDDPGKRAEYLDEVFGDVLPSVTSDESGRPAREPGSDDWYEENRPPHHDRE